MFLLRSPAVAGWLLAGAGAYSTGAAWAGNGQTGKLHPWVLVAVFWGVALLSVSVHYLRQYLAQAAVWARRSWHQSAPERARLMRRARLTLAQASAGARRSWHRHATEGARLIARARLTLAQASAGARRSWHRHATEGARLIARARLTLARTAGSLMRSVRHLAHRHAALASAGTLVGQGWEAAQHAWQQVAGARGAR